MTFRLATQSAGAVHGVTPDARGGDGADGRLDRPSSPDLVPILEFAIAASQRIAAIDEAIGSPPKVNEQGGME